ncbi:MULTISPECIES: L-rhamnose mutarotase [Sphingobacterium]|uniref:L-rhamnose mutarotase n=1 Tax=Sphingobacterium populi TaxID=1812824 RepID=A0ABW5U8G0_9SPHI|nr:L-rhamnose mutarotase [Sphingobacterium sp. CFCC 11742]
MTRYVLALDLVDKPDLIEEYEAYHREVWPEIKESILRSGVHHMAIYRFGNRLMMVMEVSDNFSFEQKANADAESEHVQEWEKLMWKYQVAIPGAKAGEKWVLMDKIFEING